MYFWGMHPGVEKYKAFEGQYIDTAPSAVSNWLRGKIIEVRETHLSLGFEVRKEMTNPAGLLHGGMIATMMDDTIGMHLFVLGIEPFHVSVNMHIDYLGTACLGEEVRVTAKIVRKGSRILNASCEVKGITGNLLASGTVNLIPVG